VYHALAAQLRAIGTNGFAAARQAGTAAMNTAYDTVLTARSTAGGRNEEMRRLVAVLNQANLIAEAASALGLEGNKVPAAVVDALDRTADAIATGAAPPGLPPVPGDSPGAVELRDSLGGLERVTSRDWSPPTPRTVPKPSPGERLGALGDRLTSPLIRRFTVRLMVCVGVAAVFSEVLPLQRSYWVVLTVAVVLKPDFGSVFARAVQRGLGTVTGAVLGAVIIVVVPYGPWLLIPFGLLAALLPYGRSRNYGLMAVFLTPLVVVLIDLLAPGGWRLAEERLVDTLIGCAIVLLIGYAPWPASWQAHLPGRLAEAIRDVSRYLQVALASPPAGRPEAPGGDAVARVPDAGTLPSRIRLRRQARRGLSDLRTEFERTMSEPPAVSRRATAWWPALVGLDEVMDAVTATAVAIEHGAPAPSPGAVAQLAGTLDSVAAAVQAGVPPPSPPQLPSEDPLQPVTEAVRAVLGVLASPRGRAPEPESTVPTGS
jgi:hypothetical protein